MTRDHLADMEEIRRLTHRYARGVDSFDIDMILSVFAADAVLDLSDFGFARSVGHDELRHYFEELHRGATHLVHIVTNHLVDFSDEHHATGVNYVHAEMRTTSGESFRGLGYNDDVYERTPGGWLITSRTSCPLIPTEP